jgi:hypothetical protein
MSNSDDTQITLKITGARAQRGVSLSDFESFIDNFLAALRDYDRAGRGEPTKQAGHEDRRAAAVTAFRLVGFATGSGIAYLEPEAVAEDVQLPVDDVALSLATLRSITDDIEHGRELPATVVASLQKACRTAGADGAVSIGLPGITAPVVLDGPTLERLSQTPSAEAAEVSSVSGRLHLIDVEPGRVGIRTTAGIEWLCSYPPELEARVMTLIRHVVWAEGSGSLSSPLRGSFTLSRIDGLEAEQGTLFTTAPASDAELSSEQGIATPQGLDSLADQGWDDQTDDAYLAALLGR